MVNEYKWLPCEIDKMYFDKQDYKGLIYWYDNVVEINKSLQAKK